MMDEGRPRYLRIAEDLRHQILEGTLPPGERVPSESELIHRYGVAQGTVRKAMTELRTRGLVETFHGRGTFVRSRPPVRRKSSDRFRRSHRKAGKAAYLAESEQAGVEPSVHVLYVGPVEVPADVAHKLGTTSGNRVLARRSLYFSDRAPMETATSYIPWDIAEETPELFEDNPGPGGIYARLEDHGRVLEEFLEEVSARLATKEESSELALSAGAPVIELVRSAYGVDGRVLEVCATVMAADRFVLEYRIPASG
ncbi:GntR family transcriptional regulator [Nocardiopsis lucentensis]|uniref:GntR family transcriptional regulator n=1 Tax=Nocardiopsis lucentensis TaxID=53441 RepID=UPI00034D379D|nr:GntR family transcriptional regulator [Nocardiopsis lucentensis]